MKCPGCGYRRQLRDDAYVPRNECPSCGITYAKSMHRSTDVKKNSGSDNSKKDGRPDDASLNLDYQSPLDSSSLQQARRRVESKLRKQIESRRKNERHQQTLARSKEITSEAVQKRKEEWERKKQHQSEKPMDENKKVPNDKVCESPDVSDEPILLKDRVLSEESAKDAAVTKPADADMAQAEEIPAPDDTHPDVPEMMPPKPVEPENDAIETTPCEALADSFTDNADNAEHDEPLTVVEPESVLVQDNTDRDMPIDPPPVQSVANKSHVNQGKWGWLAVAWLILVAGIAGAVLSWSTIGHSVGSAKSNAIPIGLLLGFAYLATGVLGFAFFWVSSMINRQLKDIHRLLQTHLETDTEKPMPDQL